MVSQLIDSATRSAAEALAEAIQRERIATGPGTARAAELAGVVASWMATMVEVRQVEWFEFQAADTRAA